ncbi:TPA: KilA-N domain-containing protein [Klebsiella quasipneumoniae]
MSQKTISLRFNNSVHSITSDEDGMFNLNQLHKASGFSQTKKPSEWLRNSATQALILEVGIPATKSKRGKGAGTWAIEQIVYAYAAWISPEFHVAVIEAFTALANGNVKKAKEIVRTAVRVEGIPVRKEVASKIMKYGDKTFIGDMTDAVNLYVTGKTAKGIRATRTEGFNKSTPTRDRMTDNELKAITAIEALVALQIERDENKSDWMGRSSVRELINNTGNTVRSMIN